MAITRILVSLVVVVTLSHAATAHHGFGDYDPSKIITLTGTVVRFVHENPHSSVVIRVDGEDWFCLLPSAAGLARRSIQPTTFDRDQRVTLKGYPHKKQKLNMRPEWLLEAGVERSLRDAGPPLPGETSEDWVMLGEKLHGGFGSYIALGVHIGLDARDRLRAEPRTLEVTLLNGPDAPCPCIADGLQLATGATPGRGSLTVAAERAPQGVFGIVTISDRKSGRSLRYTIPGDARVLLDAWNKLPAAERLAALRTVPATELYERVTVKP